VSLKILFDEGTKLLMSLHGTDLLNSLLDQGHGRKFPIYAWVPEEASFLQVSTPKPCTCLSPAPRMLHNLPIIFFLILIPEQY